MDTIKMSEKKNCIQRNKYFFIAVLFPIILIGVNIVLLANHQQVCQILSEKFVSNMTPSRIEIEQKPSIDYRLPKSILPEKYIALFNPDLKNGKFTGCVTIHLNVLQFTSEIVLHAHKSLNIQTVNVEENETNKNIGVQKFWKDDVREFLIIKLNEKLKVGSIYNLIINFDGTLTGKIIGFYKSQYLNAKGEKRALAVAKFEPTYARQTFPCFDEPNMKAKYTISLVKPKNDEYISLSNMNEISKENYSDTEILVNFAESVPMSTYLACFIVCDFDHTEEIVTPNIGNPVHLRIYATPAQKEKTRLALSSASKILKFYTNYFQIPYPLPKLDMAAIPDFSSGALETWGLVTFRETALLFNKDTSSVGNMDRVVTVVAHELAHMWFGNLVTMDWWDELWLNEGFATYFTYLATDYAFPEWNIEDKFLIDKMHEALVFDGKLNSHPIVVKVENPDQINEVFDTISYKKGASLLRMLRNFVGDKNFQDGVTNYLNKFKYKNAKSEDLFNAIQEKVGNKFDVNTIMDTWTRQMGYPEVTVSKLSPTAFKLTQKRFLNSPKYDDSSSSEPVKSEYNYKWSIPITFISDKNPDKEELHIFDYNKPELIIETGNVKWIKFNVRQVGFYRVNYDLEIWRDLIKLYKTFSIGDRTHLLNDAFSLANADRLPLDIPLSFTRQLVHEHDYLPWSVASAQLSKLKGLLYKTPTYFKFRNYVESLLKPILPKIDWNVGSNDSYSQRFLRNQLLSLACSFEIPECLEEAGKRFKQFCDDPNYKLHQDIRSTIVKYGMWAIGTDVEWNVLWNRYLSEQDAQVKQNYLVALGYIRHPAILSRLIYLAWNPDNVRRQDYFNCLTFISRNPIGRPLVWNYIRENWVNLVNTFTLNDRYFGQMVSSVVSSFDTKTQLEEILAFFKTYPEAGAGDLLRKQAIERVKSNIHWLENNKQNVDDWLNSNPKV